MPVLLNYFFKQKILKYIYDNFKVKRTPKYSNEIILDIIWEINSTGICWNAVKSKCHFTTAYKRFVFWSKNNVFKNTYKIIRDEYIAKQKFHTYKNLYIDSMSIKNRKGSECIGSCKKFKFKNATNISIIVDENILPISIHTISGNTHDSSTIIDTIKNINFSLFDKRIKINMIADKGYIKNDYYKNKLYKNYGIKLITPFRKNMLKKNSKQEKELLSKRYKVEHTNNLILNCNRIQTIFDKKIDHFNSFIFITCTNMISKISHNLCG